MRKKIIETIKAVGLDINDFLVGSGARDDSSEIHYRPYGYNPRKDSRKEYSVQYADDIVAIWEIGKRIDKRASIDLYWEEVRWKDIHELRIKEIRIQETDEYTTAAVMPLDSFESYLRYAFDKPDDAKYYSNRKEGDAIEIYTTRYERDPLLRKQAIKHHGTRCMVCGFSFRESYGTLGDGFIEVHHIRPISEGSREVNPETDLACLCSNCHRMIHKKRDHVLTVEQLKRIRDEATQKFEQNEGQVEGEIFK